MYLRHGPSWTIVRTRAATLRQKLQIELVVSPSHSIPTSGQPVIALALGRQAPGGVPTGVAILSQWYSLTVESEVRKGGWKGGDGGGGRALANPVSSALAFVGWLLNVPATC